MAIKISFDNAHNAIQPTLVLANRNGHKLGELPVCNIVISDSMQDGAQMTFDVNKAECATYLWDSILDFKLAWAREWNMWFELYVTLDDSDDMTKSIAATALGNAELSQTNLYGVEINTEDDIDRDDYAPSVLFNPENPEASILHRILKYAPHYSIGHVDSSIAGIQRSFSFNQMTIYDCFSEIEEEIKCLITIECKSDQDGNIIRQVNAYDLEQHCLSCGERGEFTSTCSNCGSTDIAHGYGDDTSILIDKENLADSIQYSTDTGSVKNCFHMQAGDDLMTATIANCNPNGSGEIWYISDETKRDMSNNLVLRLESYDSLYNEYQTAHQYLISEALCERYNSIVQKYNSPPFSKNFNQIQMIIYGYPSLMETYYDTIDFYLYLNNSMMPDSSMQDTTANNEATKLSRNFMQYVAVRDLSTASQTTVDSAVMTMVKVIVDNRYQVRLTDAVYLDGTWTGRVIITNYSDEEDTATTELLSCSVTSDYEKYVKQMIDKALKKTLSTGDTTDIVSLFDLSDVQFMSEITKYSLVRLQAFYDACQGCLNILIDQGVADDTRNPGAGESDLYDTIYTPYYNKLGYIESEIQLREAEIATIFGKYDTDGTIIEKGLQTYLNSLRTNTKIALNLESYLGTELWKELAAYRRDDTYTNQNYVSDGLDNAQIFSLALQFIQDATKDIYKSATLQHSISASLSNLLVIKEFEPIVDSFEIGNWMRVIVDGNVYRLRLIGYQIDFEDLSKTSVTFSDVTTIIDGASDIESILSSASSMATSYDFVARQAKRGSDSKSIMNAWVENGLSLTEMRIVNSADNQDISWDSYGFTCREFIQETGEYDDKQLKIINKGLYLTDDSWRTARAGIGEFVFYNPKTRSYETSYGVIANTLVGNLILSEEVGVYNEAGSITLDKDGLSIIADKTDESSESPVFSIKKKVLDQQGQEVERPIMTLDTNGNFSMSSASVNISSENGESTRSLEDYTNSKIETSKSDILLSVSSTYPTRTELNDLDNGIAGRIETRLQLYDNNLTIRVQDIISEDTAELRNTVNNIAMNYRFDANGQYIGKEGSEAVMHLANDTMEILVGSSPATVVNSEGLIANEAAISSLHMGDYLWIFSEGSGHLTLT